MRQNRKRRKIPIKSWKVNAISPRFTDNDGYLYNMGLIKEFKGRCSRKKTITRNNKKYTLKSDGVYILNKIIKHKLIYNSDNLSENELSWYSTIDLDDITKNESTPNSNTTNVNINENKQNETTQRQQQNEDDANEDSDIDSNDNINNNNKNKNKKNEKKQNDEADMYFDHATNTIKPINNKIKDKTDIYNIPIKHYGKIMLKKLMFEVEIEDWPVRIWESWDVLENKPMFINYLADNNLLCNDDNIYTNTKEKLYGSSPEIYATIKIYPEEEFKKGLIEMYRYGNVQIKRALNILMDKEIDMISLHREKFEQQ